MEASVCIDTLFPELAAHQKVEQVALAGIEQIEFWGWRDKDIPALESATREYGVRVSNFSAHRRGSPVMPNEHPTVLADIHEAVDVAASLGCTRLMVLSNELGDGGRVVDSFTELTWEYKRDALCELLRRALELVPDHISLAIEPLNAKIDHPGNFLVSMEQAVDITSRVASPRAAVLADLYHLGVMGEDLIDIVERHTQHIGYVHIADMPGRGEPGTGDTNWDDLLKRLSAAGYTGTVGFEYMPKQPSAVSLRAVQELWKRCVRGRP